MKALDDVRFRVWKQLQAAELAVDQGGGRVLGRPGCGRVWERAGVKVWERVGATVGLRLP